MIEDRVTFVCVNFQTEFLVRNVYTTIIMNYPKARIVFVDNGSKDASTQYLVSLSDMDKNIQVIANGRNFGHGPAMEQAFRIVKTKYAFTIDTDCEVIEKGFLEEMVEMADKNDAYAVGKMMWVDKGFQARKKDDVGAYPYIHPHAMLINVSKYFTLKSFVNHGAPVAMNMIDAIEKGYKLIDYPIEKYVFHLGEGTFRHVHCPGEWQWN